MSVLEGKKSCSFFSTSAKKNESDNEPSLLTNITVIIKSDDFDNS